MRGPARPSRERPRPLARPRPPTGRGWPATRPASRGPGRRGPRRRGATRDAGPRPSRGPRTGRRGCRRSAARRRGRPGSVSRASSSELEDGAPEPAGHDALLERHDQLLAACCVEDQLTVERLREAGVDDPDGPALGLERVGGLRRPRDDRSEADEQQVAALAEDLSPADRQDLGVDRWQPEARRRAGSGVRTGGPARAPSGRATEAPARPSVRR